MAKFLDLCRRSICLITMSFMKQDILLQEKTLTEPCILIGMCTELVMNQIQNPMMWNLRLRWLNLMALKNLKNLKRMKSRII